MVAQSRFLAPGYGHRQRRAAQLRSVFLITQSLEVIEQIAAQQKLLSQGLKFMQHSVGLAVMSLQILVQSGDEVIRWTVIQAWLHCEVKGV